MRLLSAALLALVLAGCATHPGSERRASSAGEWPDARGDKGARRYSPLAQINRENVGRLRVAWTYRSGDASEGNGSTIESTPVVVEGVVYVTTPNQTLAALDAVTGRELWRYAYGLPAAADTPQGPIGINRGVAYWADESGAARRILVGTTDGRLLSLDARTGRPDPGFGRAGVVDLRAGMDRDLADLFYGMTSPPGVYEDVVVLGLSNGEGSSTESPGDIRAFDVRSGRELWRFHTVPRPGEAGHETWAAGSWKERGGANPWAGVTIDAERGLVFAATGSAGYDFYGGDREGENLFANAVLALDARTGRRIWHRQLVHHDVWDYDLPHPPTLVTVRRGGREIPAVAQVTKMGLVFVLDRLTGEPLFPIEERPVPPSAVPGEVLWPTQPFPSKPPPLVRQHAVTREEVGGITPEHDAYCKALFDKVKINGGLYTPAGQELTLWFPGMMGGATWSGASFDPATGYLYVNANDIGAVGALVAAEGEAPPFRRRSIGTDAYRFWDPNFQGCQPPPWGTLSAVDLNTGEIAWRAPLGTFPALEAQGLPDTGTPNLGGSIATAGGLVFIASTMDERFRAFDARTGEVLWTAELPAAGYAAPATYLGRDGRQYVVIAAGGGGKWGTPSGDAFVAFALEPEGAAR